MSTVVLNGSALGTALQTLLQADEIQPGSAPSYQLCKTIYSFHPLGAKMAESPIEMAQSQEREIAVPGSPEERVIEAFKKEWKALDADRCVRNCARLARVYGIASLALVEKDVAASEPLDFDRVAGATIAFSALDPMNTAGSLVLNQNPNAIDFQKTTDISVNGTTYHRSRSVVLMNEDPVYIEYTTSAFGYVGRSVYQRALFPLKSFIQTLLTDDLVTLKAGVLIAKMAQPGSIIDNVMARVGAAKRDLVKEASTGNVLSIAPDESIDTLNMQNLDGAYGMARTNILKNIATAAKMPAKLLDNETMVSGFGEGTEDAKNIAKFIAGIREWLNPLYAWFDKIVQFRAWNEEFYKTIQHDFPEEYGNVDYKTAFYRWVNAFAAEWPNLLEEPDSEKSKVDDVKLKALIAAVEVLAPMCDPDNKATLVDWFSDNMNSLKILFPNPLVLDMDALREYTPPSAESGPDAGEGAEPAPFAGAA